MSSKNYDELLKNLSKGIEIESQLLWSYLSEGNSSKNAHSFCQMLYELLMCEEKKLFVEQNYNRILLTLLCVSDFKEKNKAFQSKEKTNNKSGNNYPPYSPEALVTYFFLKDQDNHDFMSNILSRFVFGSYQTSKIKDVSLKIESQDSDSNLLMKKKTKNSFSLKLYSHLAKLSFPDSLPLNIRYLPLGYICLQKELKNRIFLQNSIYHYLIEALHTHINALNRTNRSENLLKCLIYFIKMMIIQYSCGESDIIKNFLVYFNQLRNCFGELGKMCEEIIRVLYGQMKSQGQAFRKKLRNDFTNIGVKQAQNLGREAFVITNCEDFFSCSEHCSLMNLRKLVVMGVARSSGVQNWKKYIEVVGELDSQGTFDLYKKVLQIVEYSGGLELYDSIRATQQLAVGEALKSVEKHSQRVGKERQEFHSLLLEQNEMGIFQYPRIQLSHIPVATFTRGKQAGIQELLSKNLNQMGYFRNSTPLLFYGDDMEFAKVLQVLAEYMASTDIGSARQIKLYFLPRVDCHSGISRYLASKDIWYRRFVYQPFNQKLLYPHLSPSKNTRDLLPVQLLRETLQMYLREAQQTVPIQIYRIVLEGEDGTVQSYFCNYVALGTSAQAEIIRQTKKLDKEKFRKYTDIDYIQLLTEKLTKIDQLELQLRLTEVCPLTKQKRKLEEKMKVQDLMICNLPCDYFMGSKPKPAESELQISILPRSNGKAFRREVLKKEHFRSSSSADLNESVQAFRDLFINLHVSSLEIQSANQPLTLIVDGIKYAKVHSLAIEPLYSVNNLPVTLSVQTFLSP